jgi:hypothetical protein
MKTTPYARSLAVVTACLLVGSMLTALPAQSPRAAPGTARVITAPLPTEPDDYDVLAATGDWIWAMLPGDSTVDNTSLSKDGGRTWTRLGMMPESSHYVAGAGRLAYFGGDDGLGVPYFFYPTDIDNGDWQELWSVAAAGTKAMLASNLYLVRSGHDDNVRVRFATLPKKLAKPTQRYSFTADSAYLIRLTHTAGSADYASVVDVRTAKSVGRLTLPSTAQHQVSGSAVYSLTATKAGLQLCRQPLPSGTATCSTVIGGDQRRANATLYQFGANAIVRPTPKADPLLVSATGTVTRVALPAGTTSWQRDGTGDPSRPLLRTVDALGNPHHLRVAPDGSVTEYLKVKQKPLEVFDLTLAPTQVFGTLWGWQPERFKWGWGPLQQQWALSKDSIGPAMATPFAVSMVTGSRWIVSDSRDRQYLYDAARKGARVRDADALSGPFLLYENSVAMVTGRSVATTRPRAIFGSLVAERVTAPKGKKGYWVAVRNLAASTKKPVTVQVSPDSRLFSRLFFWGDWLGTTVEPGRLRLVNWRTGTVLTRAADLNYLGDGFAVVSDDDYRLSTLNLSTGTVTQLEKGSSSLEFSAYGNRVAYQDSKSLIVRTVPGTSRPRLLGALTSGRATKKSPWKAAIDLTKPVAAGTLVIRDAKGRVVRTLATAASDTGSLRGISWTGRDTAGRQLKGRYTWELLAAASDGTGFAVSVTGDGRAGGTITAG